MNALAQISANPAALLPVLSALAERSHWRNEAENLLAELCDITVLVAKKYTNDRTAEGLQEAQCLTLGCVSLGLENANLATDDTQAQLNFLLQHGAEVVFQLGFRQIKALSALPYVAFISEFERDPFIQQRNIKLLFSEICHADPSANWQGQEIYQREWTHRQHNQQLVECAQWLRRHHFGAPIQQSDLDANAVLAIAIIFSLRGDGRIVARVEQQDIEELIRRVRAEAPEIETAWAALLGNIPPKFHALLNERMAVYQTTILKKILSKAKAKTVLREIQDCYAGNEQEVIYD